MLCSRDRKFSHAYDTNPKYEGASQLVERIVRGVGLSFLISCLAVTVGCGGDERANTIELPESTNTPEPIAEVPTDEPTTVPTEEPTAKPTDVPLPTDTPIPTETPEPPNTPEPVNTELDEEKLLASLLTINDMPTGWTGKAADFEIRTPGDTREFTCTEVPARAIGRASVDFQKSGFGPFLGHGINVYDNKREAEDSMADLSQAASECLEWTDDDGVTFTLSPLSFPNLGDETFAIRILGNIEADAIYIREGNVIIDILNAAFPVGVDSELSEQMAVLALERFKENR